MLQEDIHPEILDNERWKNHIMGMEKGYKTMTFEGISWK
jgi:hypothetical protein